MLSTWGSKQQLEPLQRDVWVGDISVDLTADTPGALAALTLQAFRELKSILAAHGFALSLSKTATSQPTMGLPLALKRFATMMNLRFVLQSVT